MYVKKLTFLDQVLENIKGVEVTKEGVSSPSSTR